MKLITVDGDVLRRARIRALEQGTSVNAFLKQALEVFAGAGAEQVEAVADLLALSRSAVSRRGTRSWTRDELHDRSR